MRNFINKINVSKYLCEHLFGDNHTDTHRISVGILIMAVGVKISKIPVDIHMVHFLLDGVGYAVHGIGAAPIIDVMAARTKNKSESKNSKDEDENIQPQ